MSEWIVGGPPATPPAKEPPVAPDPPGLIDAPTPLKVQLCARYKQSYAYATVSHRMQSILDTTVLQFELDLPELPAQFGLEVVLEEEAIKEEIFKLSDEISNNEWMWDIKGTAPDLEEWNRLIREQARSERTPRPRWFYTPWLFAECYMYRRLRAIFEESITLQHYDPFKSMKEHSLKEAMYGMERVCMDLLGIYNTRHLFQKDSVKVYNYLRMMLDLSLWGNRTDLSHIGGKSAITDLTREDPLTRCGTFRDYILVDDLEKVWPVLLNPEDERRRVDIMLDNAGFECFADMCLADFLITFRLTDQVHFHVKAMPWFVSDMTVPDVDMMISFMSGNRGKAVSMAKMVERWVDYLACGQWVVEADYAWTMPYDFHGMRAECPVTYAKLIHASLLIVKGDLNYRKLIGDINWVPSYSFKRALRDFRPTNILAMRTLKSDIVCGLERGLAQEMFATFEEWMLVGLYATAQFAKEHAPVPGIAGPP